MKQVLFKSESGNYKEVVTFDNSNDMPKLEEFVDLGYDERMYRVVNIINHVHKRKLTLEGHQYDISKTYILKEII